MLRLFSEQEPCSTCTHVNYKQKQENTDWLYKLEAEMSFPHSQGAKWDFRSQGGLVCISFFLIGFR